LHNVDCVYRDSQQPRIDYNTQVLLERIQLLEDRLTSPRDGVTFVQGSQPSGTGAISLAIHQQEDGADRTGLDVQIPLSHTANANHVLSWPLVRELLSEVMNPAETMERDATDVFFEAQHQPALATTIPQSWRLNTNTEMLVCRQRELINIYFSEVNTFFPLLSLAEVYRIHEAVVADGAKPDSQASGSVSAAEYALLLLVLCMSLIIVEGSHLIRLEQAGHRQVNAGLEELWLKAAYLLGALTPELSLRATQCAMLAR
jgi:hypothetical protein